MKILVVGKDGQVGKYLQKSLDSVENEILFLGKKDMDVSKRRDVTSLVISFLPQVIINASAYTNVEKAEADVEAAFKVNDVGVGNLVYACEQVNASLIHISTDYVFDGEVTLPYATTDTPNPKNVYGASKLAGENRIAQSTISYYILRVSWVFSEYNSNFVKTMLKRGREGALLSVVADQVGNPTFAGDVADAISLILNRLVTTLPREIYHFCGAPQCSWYEFAETIFDIAINEKLLTNKPEMKMVQTTEYKSFVDRPLVTALDCSKFEKEFNVEMPQWRSSLTELIARMK
jgi:dTDP-4-dehydrorhamnose reductase